jgi:hypothetical protein
MLKLEGESEYRGLAHGPLGLSALPFPSASVGETSTARPPPTFVHASTKMSGEPYFFFTSPGVALLFCKVA